jgi:proline iminopeptidase
MYVTIPQRHNIPETEIYTKILKKHITQGLSWDRNVIVLIHGGPGGSHALYVDIEEHLFEIADLVLIDLRGCGFSKKIAAEYCTLDNHIDDLKVILKILNLSKPVIHGCSYGALVTLGFSIKYPQLPSKQILSSCVASGKFIDIARENLQRIGTPKQIQAAERLWNGTFETQEQFLEYYSTLAPLYICKYDAMANIPASAEKIPYNIDLVNLAFTTFLHSFDFTDKLPTVKADTLIFSGKNDWIFDKEQAEILHKGIKHSILISLDKCGHFPWKDQREIFLSQVRSFIDSDVNYDIDSTIEESTSCTL